jgi:dipeptidyl aminopeptidase/acylaminoacyl peptidase
MCVGRVRTAAPRNALLSLVLLAAALGSPAAPLEVYGRLPRLENFALSPDGARVAFVTTEGDTRTVHMMALGEHHEMLKGLRMGDKKLRGIEWADNDNLLVVTSVTAVPKDFIGNTGELHQMQVYDLKHGRQFMVPEQDPEHDDFNQDEVLNIITGRVAVRHIKDHTVLFIPGLELADHVTRPALIRVDLETPQASRVVRGGKNGSLGWIVDDNGEIAAEETYTERDQRWSIFIRRDGHMQEAASGHEPIDYPELLGWGPSADTLLLARLEEGNPVWRLLSLNDGSIGPPVAEGAALDSPIEDRLTNRMIGGVRVDDTEEYVFFDPRVQGWWSAILKTFRNEHVHLESYAANFRRVIVLVEGQVHGYRYMLVDLEAHTARTLGNVYEGVTQPFEVRRITYSAADGLQIPAYLTLPRGKPSKNLPLIVLPHGGPEARDTTDFNWWPQALAEQGYAVLQPNYRGSTLNWEFVTKGFGEWGRKMQTDLSDGVRYLAGEGIADPGRVCIVGASYGGYAALAGPSLDPDVYRCAVAVAGIGDLKRMLKGEGHSRRYWDRFMGVSGPNDAALDAISPIRHIRAISVPILLIHGKDDTVVPFEQSQLMYEALRDAKKDVQLVTLKKEDHWLSRSETRLQMLESSVAFLRKYNPPD